MKTRHTSASGVDGDSPDIDGYSVWASFGPECQEALQRVVMPNTESNKRQTRRGVEAVPATSRVINVRLAADPPC